MHSRRRPQEMVGQFCRMGRQIIHMEAVVTNEAAKEEVARGDAIYTTVTPERIAPDQPRR
ncbi:MAG: hypothetical protein IH898_03550 [Planctomycetes bacterium]|nr:hypothetical protein [Planctomycetota bacterium]